MHHIFLLSHSRVVCFLFFSFGYTQIYYVEKMFSRRRGSHDDAIRYHRIVGAIRFFFFYIFLSLLVCFFLGLCVSPDHFAIIWVLTEFVDTLPICYLLKRKFQLQKPNETNLLSLFSLENSHFYEFLLTEEEVLIYKS